MFDVQLECVRAVLRSFDTATEDGKRLEAMVAPQQVRDASTSGRPRIHIFPCILG